MYERVMVTHALRNDVRIIECTVDMCLSDASSAIGVSLTTFKKIRSDIFNREWPFFKLKNGVECGYTWDSVHRMREAMIENEQNDAVKKALIRVAKRGALMRSMFDPVMVHARRITQVLLVDLFCLNGFNVCMQSQLNKEQLWRHGEYDNRVASTPMESLLLDDVPPLSALCESDLGLDWITNEQ